MSQEVEVPMEKKSALNRQSSVPPSRGSEFRKSDNGSSKAFKRREATGSLGQSKPRVEGACTRRPAPQKSKAFDKRPRTRGYQGDRQRQEVDYEERAELCSAFRPGSKKANMNHLLNFTFERRDGSEVGGWGPALPAARRHSSSAVKFNKELFLQASCQFVVKSKGDYMLYSADPDTLVDWDLVEQVRVFSHGVPSCPICLYPPTAAKITRCGHSYCWSCILHYLSLADKSWRKCPICYEAVHQKDLKSVVALDTHAYSAGQEITMKLMKRERGSTYSMPCNEWVDSCGKPTSLNESKEQHYSKLLLASPLQVQAIIDTEMTALETQMAVEGHNTLEATYIQSAIDMLKERRGSLGIEKAAREEIEGLLAMMSVDESKPTEEQHTSNKLSTPPNKDAIKYVDAFDEIVASDTPDGAESDTPVNSPEVNGDKQCDDTGVTDEDKDDQEEKNREEIPLVTETAQGAIGNLDGEINEPMTNAEKAAAKKGASTFYFYQAADGQHIYLSSLNARCMITEFGAPEKCPDTITACIVDLDSVSMTKDVRSRLRHLNHLPLSCEFQLVEIDLKPPTLSKETLAVFASEIETRRRMKQKKTRNDRQAERKMKDAERKKLGYQPKMKMSLTSTLHFPDYSAVSVPPEAFQRASSNTPDSVSVDGSGPSTPLNTPYGSPPTTSSPATLNSSVAEYVPSTSPASVASDEQSCLSFAQMLASGQHKPSEAWGQPRSVEPRVQAERRDRKARGPDSDSDSEDRVPVPVFQETFSNAFQQAFDNYLIAQSTKGSTETETNTPPGKKKKKRKEKKILFATTMVYGK